jgi:hypothetical protein
MQILRLAALALDDSKDGARNFPHHRGKCTKHFSENVIRYLELNAESMPCAVRRKIYPVIGAFSITGKQVKVSSLMA